MTDDKPNPRVPNTGESTDPEPADSRTSDDQPAPFAEPEGVGNLDGQPSAVGERTDLEEMKDQLREKRAAEDEAKAEAGDRTDLGTGNPYEDSLEQTMNRLQAEGLATDDGTQEAAERAAIEGNDEANPAGTNDADDAPGATSTTQDSTAGENAEASASAGSGDDTTQPTADTDDGAHGATGGHVAAAGGGDPNEPETAAAGGDEPPDDDDDDSDGDGDEEVVIPGNRTPKRYADRAEDEGVDDSSDRRGTSDSSGSSSTSSSDSDDAPEYEPQTATDLSIEELADPNEEWTLGKEQEVLVLNYEGMTVEFSEPEHEDEIINAIRGLPEDQMDNPHARQRAVAQVVISFPNLTNTKLTDERWVNGLTPAQRLQLGNIASGYLNAADFSVESGALPNPQPA